MLTTTAKLIKNSDGSPSEIEISHVEGSFRVEWRENWMDMRGFSGRLLELIREAEANSDPE